MDKNIYTKYNYKGKEMFSNWKCHKYKMYKNAYEYNTCSYNELKDFFIIDGSEKTKCIKDFGVYNAGVTYTVSQGYNGSFYIY